MNRRLLDFIMSALLIAVILLLGRCALHSKVAEAVAAQWQAGRMP